MTNPFDELARYYDWEHADFDGDVVMYVGFAGRVAGPILELACGTGRLLLPLLRAGASVVGVDSSGAMLEVARRALARERLARRARLHQADVCQLDLGERFPLAIFGLDSFGLLHARSDQLAALTRTREHLVDGGLLVLDVANGNLRGGDAREELVLQKVGVDPTSGRPLSKWAARSTDPAAQIDRYTYLYDEVRADGCVSRQVVQLALRYFGRFELELLLEQAGFALEALYGSYDLAPFAAESERLIAVAARCGA